MIKKKRKEKKVSIKKNAIYEQPQENNTKAGHQVQQKTTDGVWADETERKERKEKEKAR